MRRMALLLVAMLCTGTVVYAGETGKSSKDEDKGTAMTGWLCNSKCVKTSGTKNTCDKSCMVTEGDVVFIDSHGKVENIANQDMVKPHAGKKVKMKAAMNKGSNLLQVSDVVEYAGP